MRTRQGTIMLLRPDVEGHNGAQSARFGKDPEGVRSEKCIEHGYGVFMAIQDDLLTLFDDRTPDRKSTRFS